MEYTEVTIDDLKNNKEMMETFSNIIINYISSDKTKLKDFISIQENRLHFDMRIQLDFDLSNLVFMYNLTKNKNE